MNIFRSASFKLTSFYVLIVMVISISFSGVVYQISSNEIGTCMSRPTNLIRGLPPDNSVRSMINDLERMRTDQLGQSRNNLLTKLIYFNILIFALSSVFSYFFARRTLQPIEEMVEAQSRFTADASHELKTPLTAMKSEIEVSLRDRKLGSIEAKKLLRSNLEEIGKLENLSNALLELARYENKSEKNFGPVAMTDILTAAYEKVEKLAKAKNIDFETDFRDLKVRGDIQSLTELFVVLLDNAIKHSPDKSKVEVTSRKEMRHAEIKIRDHGEGIKKEDLPHIFDRFYRADSSRSKDKSTSYGLGLAIAKSIADLHEGSISVESKVGKGSAFTVKLPLAKL